VVAEPADFGFAFDKFGAVRAFATAARESAPFERGTVRQFEQRTREGHNEQGQLTFAVFNAGPVPIHLKRGQPIFLIWFAPLDRETAYKKDGPVHKGIDTELITGVAGELQSFAGLSKKVKDVDKAFGDRIHAVEREQTYYRVIGALALALVVALTVNWLKDAVGTRPSQPVPIVASPPSPPSQQSPIRP
jgi:hypothetical protein